MNYHLFCLLLSLFFSSPNSVIAKGELINENYPIQQNPEPQAKTGCPEQALKQAIQQSDKQQLFKFKKANRKPPQQRKKKRFHLTNQRRIRNKHQPAKQYKQSLFNATQKPERPEVEVLQQPQAAESQKAQLNQDVPNPQEKPKRNPPKGEQTVPKPPKQSPPKTGPSKTSPNSQSGSWEKDSLKLHNEYRNQLVTSNGSTLAPFSWREDLAEKAREWANYLVEKSKEEGNGIDLVHSTEKNWGTGENLYSTKNGDMGCGAAIDAWFNEWPLYKNEPIGQGDFSGYGHYTQLAWPDTKFIGCAYGDNGENIRFTVCEYYPPGNVVGQKLDVFVKGKQKY